MVKSTSVKIALALSALSSVWLLLRDEVEKVNSDIIPLYDTVNTAVLATATGAIAYKLLNTEVQSPPAN